MSLPARRSSIASNDNSIGKVKPKPDLIRVIGKTLGDHVRFTPRHYELWQNGRWIPATFAEVMRAVNRKRKAIGFVQITLLPEWIV